MKQLVILLAAFGFWFTAQAQHSCVSKGLTKHPEFVNSLLRHQVQNPGLTRSLTERLLGQSTYDHTFGSSLADSVKLTYILNGTSTFDLNSMLYLYNYPYATSPLFENNMGIITEPWIFYDTYWRGTVNPNTLVYGFYSQDNAEYDANNNMTHDTIIYADSSSYPNMIHINNFNTNNQPVSTYSYTWVGGNADTLFKQFYSYDAFNRLEKDSTYEKYMGNWYIVSKTLYTHDGMGNVTQIRNYSNQDDTLLTSPLIEQLRYINTFDGSNRLSTVLTCFWDGTAINPYVKDTFEYTGSLMYHTTWREHQFDAINGYWAPMFNMMKYLNANNLPDTVDIMAFDSLANAWVNDRRQVFTWTTNDNPQTMVEYIYNFTAWPASPNFSTTYYYELFNNTTGISPVEDNNNIAVYPNPSGSIINIAHNGETGTFYLYDVNGNNILNGQFKQNASINVSTLENGVYAYRVVSNGKDVKTGKIVVAH